MRLTWITVIAYATSALAVPTQGPGSLDAMEPHSRLPSRHLAPDNSTAEIDLNLPDYEVEESILLALLAQIKFEHKLINATLRRFPEPMNPISRKFATRLVSANFKRITHYLTTADAYLQDKPPPPAMDVPADADADAAADAGSTALVERQERGRCGKLCLVGIMISAIRETTQATLTSLLKLGLSELGKSIHPAFLALSGTVLTVNNIVGATLSVVAGLVNGFFLALAAGIAYLDKLASDDQRERAGGPLGPITMGLAKVLGILMKALGKEGLDDNE